MTDINYSSASQALSFPPTANYCFIMLPIQILFKTFFLTHLNLCDPSKSCERKKNFKLKKCQRLVKRLFPFHPNPYLLVFILIFSTIPRPHPSLHLFCQPNLHFYLQITLNFFSVFSLREQTNCKHKAKKNFQKKKKKWRKMFILTNLLYKIPCPTLNKKQRPHTSWFPWHLFCV